MATEQMLNEESLSKLLDALSGMLAPDDMNYIRSLIDEQLGSQVRTLAGDVRLPHETKIALDALPPHARQKARQAIASMHEAEARKRVAHAKGITERFPHMNRLSRGL